MLILTLLFLVAMLADSCCREDKNYMIIALASAIVLIGGIAPEWVCVIISFGLVISIVATMLAKDSCWRKDNNYVILAIASTIILNSSLAPEWVCAAISFGMVVSIVLVHLCGMDLNIEDHIICKIAEKLFEKPLPPELNQPDGAFGGGFAELCIRVELRKPTDKRSKSIQYGCRIIMIFLALAALILSLIQVISSLGWWATLAIPASILITTLTMSSISMHIWFYQSDGVTK